MRRQDAPTGVSPLVAIMPKKSREVLLLREGPDPSRKVATQRTSAVAICNDCVAVCNRILAQPVTPKPKK